MSAVRARRPESVTVAALLLVFAGTLHVLASTVLAWGTLWMGWFSWQWGLGFAGLFFGFGVLSVYAAGGVWHLLPGSRRFAVLAAVVGLVNVPLAWPFAGAAWHLLSKASARRALPAHTLRGPAGFLGSPHEP